MTETLFALVLFLFPLAYSPGPGNLFFAANGARFGLLATLPASAGYHLATWIVTAVTGLGLISVLDAVPGVFAAVKIAGSLWVLRIAWRMIRAGAGAGPGEARPASFADGAALLLFNPKAYVIIALMFSQFLAPGAENRLLAVVLIATVFTLNNFVAFSVWTVAGERLAASFLRPGSARRINLVFGLALIAVALWMLPG